MLERLLTWSDRLRQKAREKRQSADFALGRKGEDYAHRHLRAKGYTILARNFQTRGGAGEVDLVALDGDVYVFVEVKSRSSDAFGAPDRAVSFDKMRKIRRAAREFLRRKGVAPDTPSGMEIKVRYDLVSIVFADQAKLEHYPDAFYLPF